MSEHAAIPVLKIGAVVVRRVASRQPVRHSSKSDGGSPVASASDIALSATHHILILQPIPKRAGEVPAFVLPRGSRQYQDEAGAWHDARDAATGAKYSATLEPFARGLAREIEEEAGVTPAMLQQSRVTELGALAFQSRTKGVYPIHWFVVELDEIAAQQLLQQTPVDALAVRWATLHEIKEMAACGEFSAGYIPVIERVLADVA